MNSSNVIYDSRKQLGMPRTLVLGLQHVFAMFGATVLVPLLTGLSVSVTLFAAGIATLWFHFITKKKVPIFLGSSFAFLGAFATISGAPGEIAYDQLPYVTGGILVASLLYALVAIFIHFFGAKKVMKLFPPVVTGPIIILIGLILAPSALNNITANLGTPRFILAIIAVATVIICNMWGKGMIKLIPILCGIVVSYIVACLCGWVSFESIMANAGVSQVPGALNINFNNIIALPPFHLPKFRLDAIITCTVVAIVAMIEHVGDICAIGATCDKNFIKDPGLARTLLGDGIGTALAALMGGPANTTYSENTGVVALTGVQDTFVLRVAAVMAIILSIFPVFDGAINTIPTEIVGGISFILYGMISAVGLRTLVENHVDYSKTRNVIITAIIMVSGLAFNQTPLQIGPISFGGLATAAIFGIILNLVLPGQDYDFKDDKSDENLVAFGG